MKTVHRISRLLFLATALGGFAFGTSLAASLKAGQSAPLFSITTLEGKEMTSASLAGKVTLVHFWATWCPPCREEMPALNQFYRDHHDEGVEVIAISVEDDAAKVKSFAAALNYPVALMNNSRVEGFGRVWALPLTFVIDRNGRVRKTEWTGAEKLDAASLNKFVLPLLSEK